MVVYYQAAAKKRSRRHLTETDEFVTGNNEGCLIDAFTMTSAYQKMKSLCLNIRNEIFTDMEIHNQHVLPRYMIFFLCQHYMKLKRKDHLSIRAMELVLQFQDSYSIFNVFI